MASGFQFVRGYHAFGFPLSRCSDSLGRKRSATLFILDHQSWRRHRRSTTSPLMLLFRQHRVMVVVMDLLLVLLDLLLRVAVGELRLLS